MSGASSEQKQLGADQTSLFHTMGKEASDVFGQNSALYGNLLKAFEPILAAGPSQEGFSAQEKGALNAENSSGVSANYQNAAKTMRERYAGQGGGNEYVPSGQQEQVDAELASSAADQEATGQEKITTADYETGRSNWLAAEQGLEGAGSAFSPAIALDNAATGSGTAASNTANQITQANNSWQTAAIGAVAGLGGAVLTGGMSNLGGGTGFFG